MQIEIPINLSVHHKRALCAVGILAAFSLSLVISPIASGILVAGSIVYGIVWAGSVMCEQGITDDTEKVDLV